MPRFLIPIAVAALVLAGCGAEKSDETSAPEPVTVTETETETVTETQPATTESEPEVECSTAGLRLTLPEQELPPAVADVRKRVFDAAVACDYDTLEQIALEQGEGFTFSYGGGTDASEYWRSAEESSAEEPKPMHALVAILTIPHTRNESGSYAWPSAYDETPANEDWQAVVDAGLYTQAEVAQMREPTSTGYVGWRTAITPDGDWQFFVAGD